MPGRSSMIVWDSVASDSIVHAGSVPSATLPSTVSCGSGAVNPVTCPHSTVVDDARAGGTPIANSMASTEMAARASLTGIENLGTAMGRVHPNP